jgi:hypothetical protein
VAVEHRAARKAAVEEVRHEAPAGRGRLQELAFAQLAERARAWALGGRAPRLGGVDERGEALRVEALQVRVVQQVVEGNGVVGGARRGGGLLGQELLLWWRWRAGGRRRVGRRRGGGGGGAVAEARRARE